MAASIGSGKFPSYGQYCPVALAAEILCLRWTPLILRELLLGSRRFNDLRRGIPRLSPSLLSDRLHQLQLAGIVEHKTTPDGLAEYCLTPAGLDFAGIILGLAQWGTRWIDTRQSLANLDPTFLMWDIRRNLHPDPVPSRRVTVQFHYPDLAPAKRSFWLVVEGAAREHCAAEHNARGNTGGGNTGGGNTGGGNTGGGNTVDLCYVDPGFEVDLYIESTLRTMTAIWMGASSVRGEMRAGRLEISGDAEWRRHFELWLGQSPMARLRAG